MQVVFSIAAVLGFVFGQTNKCPSFTEYSASLHGPLSLGSQHIPSMRPALACRTFQNPTIEHAIRDVSSAIKDPDWQQLFANTFPNTLDTTVAWHNGSTPPYTFLITGDITAQWIRDSTNQVLPYLPYLTIDSKLAQLVLGLVNMQAEELNAYPFGNAFQPPLRSRLTPAENGIAVDLRVQPPFNNQTVFEAKFEIDSFASFFQLASAYWRSTGEYQFIYSQTWVEAVDKILDIIRILQQPTYTNNKVNRSLVSYVRKTTEAKETQFAGGPGNPVKYTGMVRTLFRPSDDATMFPFLVPANAFLCVELENLRDMLDTLRVFSEIRDKAAELAVQIRNGIQKYGIVKHPDHGQVFAYEVDGYGSQLLADDANVPSLLSLPYLGFVNATHPVYKNTRKMLLSTDSNPWYFEGPYIRGIGSPHTGYLKTWPMSVAIRGMTSDNSDEVKECLDMLKASTSGLGLIHESVSVNSGSEYTRSWFAWGNSLVSQFVIDAITRFPGII
ncbi:meiotically up-regulated gene 157 protein [Coemansia mojavensis]|nr:meiotically up-regulated gene 157 protein [Coemansia mojavensis]